MQIITKAVAIAATFGLMASAKADILTVFDVSGTLSGSPNSNPATFSGSFTLDQTNGTLAAFDVNTPIGAINDPQRFIVVNFLTTSNGPAFGIAGTAGGGIVGLGLAFAGTVDGFTGGDVLTQVSLSGPPGPPLDPSSLYCDLYYSACDGKADAYNVVSGVATEEVATTVPEPGSLSLLGPAIAGIGLRLRARRKRAAEGKCISEDETSASDQR